MTSARSRTSRVYEDLLRGLSRGAWRPGAIISVKDTAERFRVSPTPVREALERLVGSGAVEQSVERTGFVVPRLGLGGYLHRIEAVCLLAEAAWKGGSSGIVTATDPPPDADLPIELVRWAFEPALCRTPNAVVASLAHRMSITLSAYHNVEPDILRDWRVGLLSLRQALIGNGGGVTAIRAFARRRRLHAPMIVDVAESR